MKAIVCGRRDLDPARMGTRKLEACAYISVQSLRGCGTHIGFDQRFEHGEFHAEPQQHAGERRAIYLVGYDLVQLDEQGIDCDPLCLSNQYEAVALKRVTGGQQASDALGAFSNLSVGGIVVQVIAARHASFVICDEAHVSRLRVHRHAVDSDPASLPLEDWRYTILSRWIAPNQCACTLMALALAQKIWLSRNPSRFRQRVYLLANTSAERGDTQRSAQTPTAHLRVSGAVLAQAHLFAELKAGATA